MYSNAAVLILVVLSGGSILYDGWRLCDESGTEEAKETALVHKSPSSVFQMGKSAIDMSMTQSLTKLSLSGQPLTCMLTCRQRDRHIIPWTRGEIRVKALCLLLLKLAFKERFEDE